MAMESVLSATLNFFGPRVRSAGTRRTSRRRHDVPRVLGMSPSRKPRRRSVNRLQPYLVRADGIEPTRPAWKAGVLPLNYARVAQERRDSSMRVSGQARNIVCPILQTGRKIGFSPGFYPVSDCEGHFCAVVWNVWHSSLRRLPPRFKTPVRPLRKRRPT